MVQFFNRLPADSVFERRNWLVHLDDEPFHPRGETWPALSRDDAPRLVVRSERQTLRRLDHDTIVFTIRVTCHRLAEIAAYPDAMTDLLAAFASMDVAERTATGFTHYGDVVTAYLHAMLSRLNA
jgi:hypothetical protein